jgi:hypothetical protein
MITVSTKAGNSTVECGHHLVLNLLVEDDEALRELGRVMLEAYGYTVLLAGDGAAALELAQNHAHPIHAKRDLRGAPCISTKRAF